MSRRQAAVWLLVAAAGHFAFVALFSRFSNATQWNVAVSPSAATAAAIEAASRFGIDVRGWRSETEARTDRDLVRHLSSVGSKDLQRTISLAVGFGEPNGNGRVGVRLDAAGRPTAVTIRGLSRPEGKRVVANAQAIAETAFRSFVPDHSAYSKLGEEPLAGGGTRFRWEAPGADANRVRRASIDFNGGAITEIRFVEDVRKGTRPPSVIVDNLRDVAAFIAGLFGLVLYLVGSAQRAIPQRLAMITGGLVYLLIVTEIMVEMDPALSGLFGPSQGGTRWMILLGIVLFALPAGLALTGGYPSLARSRPRQLLTWESLLLRGQLGSSSVATSVLVGVAVGGWIAAVPHLIRATGLLGDYLVADGVIDAIYRSGLTPVSLFGDFLLATVAFGVCVPFVVSRLPHRVALPVAFLIVTVLLLLPQDPLAASIVGAIALTLLLFTLFERHDLLAVVVAALSAGWAAAAASRLVQSSDAVRHEGAIALAVLAAVALLAAAIAVFGSKAPHIAWQAPPARAERKRMQREFAVARLAQERMLPELAPQLPGIELASYCQPARQVGGDLYDFVTMPEGKVGVAVADVSGKGVPAALIMTITKGLLLAASDGESDPRTIVGQVNAGIHSLRNKSSFVTMIFGVIDASRRTFEFVRAGHTALLWRRNDGSVESIAPRGIGLGMSASRTFRVLCETRTVAPAKGEFLLLYSDGITEAMNERSEEFGDDRLIETVRANLTPEMSAEDARDAIIGEVAIFCDTAPVHDDMTLVVVKW